MLAFGNRADADAQGRRVVEERLRECVFDPSAGESLCRYLERLADFWAPAIAALPPTSVSHLLVSLHARIIHQILKHYEKEHNALIHLTVTEALDRDSQLFWHAAESLRLSLHFEPELVHCAASHFYSAIDAQPNQTRRFSELCSGLLSPSKGNLRLAGISHALLTRWEGLLYDTFRGAFVKSRSKTLFDCILNYPESQKYILDFHPALYPGALLLVLCKLRDSYFLAPLRLLF